MDAKHIASFVHSSRLILFAAIVVSCSVLEKDDVREERECSVFYASFEQPSEVDGTRVTVREDLKVVWDQGDLISLFNKKDANEEYRFTGKTGDNGGTFELVKDFSEEGVARDDIHAVYPYSPSTSIDTKGTLSVTLPAEQNYKSHSFGQGANLMAAVSKDKNLQFRNACGYLCVQLFGRDISVSSITLKGNNGEKIAGKATITMPMNGVPTVTMDSDATTEITLICKTPVQLGATAWYSIPFWFVVPPMSFSKGFTITVTEITGGSFEMSTSKSISIERNRLSRMSPIKVDPSAPRNVILYTSSDDKIVTPRSDVFGAEILSNEYVDGHGIITFDGDVTSIGYGAFSRCTNLASVILPDGVTSIGNFAFDLCTSLAYIRIPDSVTSLGIDSFYRCESLHSIEIPTGVTSIGDGAFLGCSRVSGITLPEGLTSIGYSMFRDCSSLSSINIPSGVTSIGEQAFSFCFDLIKVSIPEGVTSIGEAAFVSCPFSSIILPQSITSIGDWAFGNCSLSSVAIPENVTNIGKNAFNGCSRLNSIILFSKTPPIAGPELFNDTNDCPIYVFPESVDVYKSDPNWYMYASRIQAMTESVIYYTSSDGCVITQGVNSFGGFVISNEYVDGLGTIRFYGKVNDVSFYACSSLTSVIIPESVTSIERSAFSYCTNLTNIFLPEEVTSIESFAFMGCTSLTSIVLPEAVTSIEEYAFFCCSSLTSVIIPKNVKSIGQFAFWACHNLTSVTVLPEIPPIATNLMFETDCPIYVPAGSVEAYKSAEGWSLHADRIQAIPE